MNPLPKPLPIRIAELETNVDGSFETRFMALWEGKPAGTVAVRSIAYRKMDKGVGVFRARTVAYLYQLFVHEAARDRGVGKKLVECACNTALVHGCRSISLNVSPDNADVLSFYSRLGFQPTWQESDGTLFLCRQLLEWNPVRPPTKEIPV